MKKSRLQPVSAALLTVALLLSVAFAFTFISPKAYSQSGAARENTANFGPISVKTADGTTVNYRGVSQFVFQNGTISGSASGKTITVGALKASAALDFDLTSVASQDLTITLTGATVGEPVALGVPNASVTADTQFTAWVSAADTVKVRALRVAGTPNPASGTFTVAIVR